MYVNISSKKIHVVNSQENLLKLLVRIDFIEPKLEQKTFIFGNSVKVHFN